MPINLVIFELEVWIVNCPNVLYYKFTFIGYLLNCLNFSFQTSGRSCKVHWSFWQTSNSASSVLFSVIILYKLCPFTNILSQSAVQIHSGISYSLKNLYSLDKEPLLHMCVLVVSVLEVVQVISVIDLEEKYAWLKQDAELSLWHHIQVVYIVILILGLWIDCQF